MTIKVVRVDFIYSKNSAVFYEERYVNCVTFTEDYYKELLSTCKLYTRIGEIMDGHNVSILHTIKGVKEFNIYDE